MPITQLANKKSEISVKVGKETVTEDIGQLSLPAIERNAETKGLATELPKNIPNAHFASTVINVENPSLHIIVVEQTHGVERSLIRDALSKDLSKKMSKEKIPGELVNELTTEEFKDSLRSSNERAAKTQKDIIEIVKFFKTEHAISSVYAEGLEIRGGLEQNDPEKVKAFLESKKEELPKAVAEEDLFVDKFEKVKSALATRTDLSEKDKNTLLDYVKRFPNEIFKRMDKVDELRSTIETSSGARLQAEGITLVPTEMSGVHGAAKKLESSQTEILMDAREDSVIQVANMLEKSGGDKVAIVIYGRAHDFENNVRAFNAANRDQIMLSVITPESLSDKK